MHLSRACKNQNSYPTKYEMRKEGQQGSVLLRMLGGIVRKILERTEGKSDPEKIVFS